MALLQTVNLLQVDLQRSDATSRELRRAAEAQSPVFLDAYEIYNAHTLLSDVSKRSGEPATNSMFGGGQDAWSRQRSIPFPHGKFSWEHKTKTNGSNATSLAAQVANWTQAQISQVNESSPEVQQRVQAFTNYTTTSTAAPTPAPASNASLYQKEAPKVEAASPELMEAAKAALVSSAHAQHQREGSASNESQTIVHANKLEPRHVGTTDTKLLAIPVTSPSKPLHSQTKLVLGRSRQRRANTDVDSIIDEIMSLDH
jgi:hypothetical protein